MTLLERIIAVIQAIGIDIKSKQNILISGTNIKTVNNQSLLGSGDISISSEGSSFEDGFIISNAFIVFILHSHYIFTLLFCQRFQIDFTIFSVYIIFTV